MTVKFADEITRLKSTDEWKSADRHAVSLVKDDALNVLLMVLKKGAHLHEHRTKGPITVQLVSGSIRFSGGPDQRVISAGVRLWRKARSSSLPQSIKVRQAAVLPSLRIGNRPQDCERQGRCLAGLTEAQLS
jgi:hypothetical protein